MLTFRWVELVVVLFTPACWSNICGVRVDPKVVALQVPVDVQTQPIADHLAERERERDR